MPTPFASSFASAAAGSGYPDGALAGRNTGSGDWSRTRPNGATQTFRRPSVANPQSQQRDSTYNTNSSAPTGSVYVPPHMSATHQTSVNRNGISEETRYSKDQLLDMYRAQEKLEQPSPRIEDLFVDGWHPRAPNGTQNGGWGKKDPHGDAIGTDLCWDYDGGIQPISLNPMSEEEHEVFSNTVNSTLKPAQTNKDSNPRDSLNRRTSLTQSHNTSSPASRPAGRRRDSGDLLQSGNLASPGNGNRYSKEESGISSPPPSLLRRRTDYRDNASDEKDSDNVRSKPDLASPFGSLKRTSTQPMSAGINGPSSPWAVAPQSAGFAPMGTFGSFSSSDTNERRSGFGSVRGESRFKGLMNTSNAENINPPAKEKPLLGNLERLPESTNERASSRWSSGKAAPTNTDQKELYADEDELPAGSAALLGDEPSPPLPQSSRTLNLGEHTQYDDIGFSSLGVGSDMPPFRDMMQRREIAHQQTPQRNRGVSHTNESMSPATTNPYQSPEGDRAVPNDVDVDERDPNNQHYTGSQGFGQPSRGLQNQFDNHDRSQTQNSAASKSFPSLGGLGNLGALGGGGAWSAAPGAVGTPSRAHPGQTPGFGDAFSQFGDLNSAGIGGGFFGSTAPATSNPGAIGGRSKLGSFFPATMHDQPSDPSRSDMAFGEGGDIFQRNAPGFGSALRDTDSPRPRGGQADEFGAEKRMSGISTSIEKDSTQAPTSAGIQTPFSTAPAPSSYFARGQEPDIPGMSTQLPASQQRQMVMPDRMRWIYRDPQGNTQGPWSGLEMHDWYKAGFFSPELQVKKLEDADYEPLAQLIRRIGNSREPFLVPQIGIPHGSSAAQPSAAATAPSTTPSAAQANSAQPPFASSFPSFGTTLTAEQQNALERRKQEEQYLMARQKEHLAQQQVILKQMQHMQGGLHGQQLHHQSSGHSLHSQPSYGSITSPSGYHPPPATGPIQPPPSVPGFYDGVARNAGPSGPEGLSSVREEDLPGFLERLAGGRGGQSSFNAIHNLDHQQQVNLMLQERARLEREQAHFDMIQRDDDGRTATERMQQFGQLRAHDEEHQYQPPAPIGNHVSRPTGQQQQQRGGQDQFYEQQQQQTEQRRPQELTLSEQVQQAAAKQASAVQPPSPWTKVESGLPQPFPPPQSASPMPAPTPQRNRQSVADALNAESQPSSHPDSAETPSASAIAPWAKESGAEGSKGPSLKEIQAMEAQKAAQREEVQAAARRQVAEQERLNQPNPPVVPAPGLPSSANWASSVSPAIPAAAGASPWAKPNAIKPVVATPVPGTKKTLAQIQKEEEARKNRAASTAASNASSAAPIAGGKRYADLASKGGPAPLNPNNSAWSTVGAGGKVKTPVAAAPNPTTRSASGGLAQAPAIAAKSKPTVNTGRSTQQTAKDDFQKWTKNAISKGLDSKIPLDGFVASLLDLPAEPDIISDSIYANSQTLDGRRFAEEFVRRRKLADRGIIPDPSPSGTTFSSASNGGEGKSGSGGWSEVAKKGGQPSKADDSANPQFKVVAGKKKGGKR